LETFDHINRLGFGEHISDGGVTSLGVSVGITTLPRAKELREAVGVQLQPRPELPPSLAARPRQLARLLLLLRGEVRECELRARGRGLLGGEQLQQHLLRLGAARQVLQLLHGARRGEDHGRGQDVGRRGHGQEPAHRLEVLEVVHSLVVAVGHELLLEGVDLVVVVVVVVALLLS